MTSIFAMVGMFVLLSLIVDLEPPVTAALAFLWGIFVFSIDYLVVTFVDLDVAFSAAMSDPDRPGRMPHRGRSLLRTIIRVVFAVLVGLAVGESLVIGVFSPAAVRFLAQEDEDHFLERLCAVNLELSRYRPEVQPAADCATRVRASEGSSNPAAPAAPSTTVPSNELPATSAADVARLAELDKQILFFNDRAQCELYPERFSAERRASLECSGIPGNGGAYELARDQVNKIEGEKAQIQQRLSEEATRRNDLQRSALTAEQQRLAGEQERLKGLRDSEPALEAVKTKTQLEQELRDLREGRGQTYGLNERFEATEKAVNPWIRWGLRLLFVLADLAPVLMKTTMGPSQADQMKAIWGRRRMLYESADYDIEKDRIDAWRESVKAAANGDQPQPPPEEHPFGNWRRWQAPPWQPTEQASSSRSASNGNANHGRSGSSNGGAPGTGPVSGNNVTRPRPGNRAPRPAQAMMKMAYPELIPAFDALNWTTWTDIGIDPKELREIGELGRVTVFDYDVSGRGMRAQLYLAQHRDFPTLPLVVKCARRRVVKLNGRRPSYWPDPTDTPPDIPLHSSAALEFEEPAYHLANEIEFARQVRGLPNIVPAVTSGHAGLINGKWHVYVAYPYFPKADLESLIYEQGHLTPPQFLDVGQSLLTALDGVWITAQQRHRDIKLSNLLVDNNGGVWLTDFEVAGPLGMVTTRFRKTPAYSAPEVLIPDNAPSVRSVAAMAADAYSVGAVLYTLKTGTFPHWSTVRKHGEDQEVSDWELGQERAKSRPAMPINMSPAGWAELSVLLEPDPYVRVGLDDLGLRRLVDRADMSLDIQRMSRAQALRILEEDDPDDLQRALSENVLGSMARFMETEKMPALQPGSE